VGRITTTLEERFGRGAIAAEPSVLLPSADLLPAEPDRLKWLAWRRDGLGGSDAAAVCGLSPWATPYTTWLEKTGQLPLVDRPPSRYQRWGTLLEPALRDAFEEETQLAVVHVQSLVVNRERPWLRATLDGLAEGGVTAVFESKASNGRDGRWDRGVPDYYLIQVQHQLAVTGLDLGYVAVLLGGADFEVYEVPRDEAAIGAILSQEERFWTENVGKGLAPVVDSSEETGIALRAAFAESRSEKSIELPVETAARLIDDLRSAKEASKDAESRERAAANTLMALLGDAEFGLLEGQVAITWKTQSNRRIDVQALRDGYPEVAKAVLKETSTRVLRLKTNGRNSDG